MSEREPLTRVYTRPYFGILKDEVLKDWTGISSFLLAQGKPGLVMQSASHNSVKVEPVRRQVFRCDENPALSGWYTHYFSLILGPFRTARAAYLLAECEELDPHHVTVRDVECIALAQHQLQLRRQQRGW